MASDFMKFHTSATELSKKLGVSQPSVSISLNRGEKIAKADQLELVEGQKVKILWGVPYNAAVSKIIKRASQ
jgi:hypothetical protein